MSTIPTVESIDKSIQHLKSVLSCVLLRMNDYSQQAKEAARYDRFGDAAGYQAMSTGLIIAEALLRDELKLLDDQRRAVTGSR